MIRKHWGRAKLKNKNSKLLSTIICFQNKKMFLITFRTHSLSTSLSSPGYQTLFQNCGPHTFTFMSWALALPLRRFSPAISPGPGCLRSPCPLFHPWHCTLGTPLWGVTVRTQILCLSFPAEQGQCWNCPVCWGQQNGWLVKCCCEMKEKWVRKRVIAFI